MTDYQISRDAYSRKNKFIDLKINGRLFPSWILANFKKYKLEDIVKTGDDPCAPKTTTEDGQIRYELKKYQLFLSSYLDFKSPHRDILIYHGLSWSE